MNIFFGTRSVGGLSSPHSLAHPQAVAERIRQLYGVEAQPVVDDSCGHLWAAHNSGIVSGTAKERGVFLTFLGTLHHPLVDWRGVAPPMDDPHAAARYLLERYHRMGENFAQDVVGQYAVVICDPSKGRTLLASDPLGHRTLYFRQRAGRLSFSSNLHTLTAQLGSELRLDRSHEDFLLLYGFYPQGRTAFEDVKALDKGRVLVWEDGAIRYHQTRFANPWKKRFGHAFLEGASEPEVVEVLYEGFMSALGEQLTGDDRVGVLLGGFDSALVAAALQRLGKKVETFSFDYDAGEYNQPHTDTLQKHLGHTHHRVKLTQSLLREGLLSFSKYFNQPTNWPNYVIQTADACRYIQARGIRVCYTGDGCDSVFMGYPGTYRRARVFETLPTVPLPLSRAIARVAARPLLDRRLGHPYRVGLSMLRSLGRRMPSRGFMSFRVMDEVSLHQLRGGPGPLQKPATEQVVNELAEPHRGLSGLRLAYLGKGAVSPNRNKMVGSSDQTGIALLSPYMHPGMKHLSLSLPDELCRPQAKTPSKVTGKYILMKMAEDKGLLPKDVIFQPKVAAVDGPIDEWYSGPLRPLMLQLMEGLPFEYSRRYANHLLSEKLAEALFKKHLMTDKVISHAASLAVTYAAFANLAKS